MDNDRIAKRVYVGVRVGSRLIVRSGERWIDSMNGCLKKGLTVGQARRMMYDRNQWWEFVKGNAWGLAWG